MNYLDILPCESQNYIKAIVYAQMIQSVWRGQHYRKRYAFNIAKKYTDKEWNNSVFCPKGFTSRNQHAGRVTSYTLRNSCCLSDV